MLKAKESLKKRRGIENNFKKTIEITKKYGNKYEIPIFPNKNKAYVSLQMHASIFIVLLCCRHYVVAYFLTFYESIGNAR